MDKGNWVPIDKNLIKCLPNNRQFTELEAMFSHSVDIDTDNAFSVNGYSKLWGWSRNKVRLFLEKIKRTPKGQGEDTQGTGRGQGYRLIYNNLENRMDTKRTTKGQEKDTKRYTTINPNTKPNPKKITFSEDSSEFRIANYLWNKILKRNPKAKHPNLQQWSKDADLILRIDKRELSEIIKIIDWCQDDSFWHTNILSVKKLRIKYDALFLKMNAKGNEGNNNQNKQQNNGYKSGADKIREREAKREAENNLDLSGKMGGNVIDIGED